MLLNPSVSVPNIALVQLNTLRYLQRPTPSTSPSVSKVDHLIIAFNYNFKYLSFQFQRFLLPNRRIASTAVSEFQNKMLQSSKPSSTHTQHSFTADNHNRLVRTKSAPQHLGLPMICNPKKTTQANALRHNVRVNVLVNRQPNLLEAEAGEDDSSSAVIDLTNDDSSLPRPMVSRQSPGTASNLSILPGLEKLKRNALMTTGLVFDQIMLMHSCTCGNTSSHPEHSGRLQSIWTGLVDTGLTSRCSLLRPRMATPDELRTVHTENHVMFYGCDSSIDRTRQDFANKLVRMDCGGLGADSDTIWNELHTCWAAQTAAGCVIDLAFKTVQGEVKNGFAVVRPPGHHAERDMAMGFCYFNSIAIAAKLLLERLPSRVCRVLVIDWDIHHGNGTQEVFYNDPRVLFVSIQRYDDGYFFPGESGNPIRCGYGPGLGYNVNISWSGGLEPSIGDPEYLAAFRSVVMPIAHEFNPDVVLVSAGFDATAGHSPKLGGYKVSPACFGHFTRELMKLAGGKVVMALEGGYHLEETSESVQECIKALLEDETTAIAEVDLQRVPVQRAVDTLQKTIAIQV